MELSVAMFAGMAAAMLVSPVRRSVPRWIEALIWLGLIIACWLAITNFQDANVRYLTESAAWGARQILNTMFGLMIAAVLAWIGDHRFVIANAVVILVGADILLLSILRSHRQAQRWMPRIMLGEWFEVPLHRAPDVVPVPVSPPIDEWNRRAERAVAVLGAAFLARLLQLLIWARVVVVPRAARVVIGGDGVLTDEQVINMRTLLSAQSIGWYGPTVPASEERGLFRERKEDESDRLAS